MKNWTTFIGGTWSDSQTSKSWPAFWRASFKNPLQAGVFATIGLRTSGLSSGSVWVNGHNLGRFSGNTQLYLPEGWLAADNTVVIYDASGSSRSQVKLEVIESRARSAGTATGGAGGSGGSSGVGGVTGTTGGRTTGGSSGGGAGGGVSGQGGSAGRTTGAAGSSSATSIAGSSGGRSAIAGASATAGSAAGAIAGGVAGSSGPGAGEGGRSSSQQGGSAGTSTTGASSAETGTSGAGCSCDLGGQTTRSSAWVFLAFAMLWYRRRRSGP